MALTVAFLAVNTPPGETPICGCVALASGSLGLMDATSNAVGAAGWPGSGQAAITMSAKVGMFVSYGVALYYERGATIVIRIFLRDYSPSSFRNGANHFGSTSFQQASPISFPSSKQNRSDEFFCFLAPSANSLRVSKPALSAEANAALASASTAA